MPAVHAEPDETSIPEIEARSMASALAPGKTSVKMWGEVGAPVTSRPSLACRRRPRVAPSSPSRAASVSRRPRRLRERHGEGRCTAASSVPVRPRCCPPPASEGSAGIASREQRANADRAAHLVRTHGHGARARWSPKSTGRCAIACTASECTRYPGVGRDRHDLRNRLDDAGLVVDPVQAEQTGAPIEP